LPKAKIQDLNEIYQNSDTVDQYLWAEQRSNILLVGSEHYSKRFSRFFARLRDNRQLTNTNRLRLTENHLQRVSKHIQNSILNIAPDVGVFPANEKELQDVKAAELNASVWKDWKYRHKWRKKRRDRVKDFVDIGEVAVELLWDPNQGKLLGMEALTNEEGLPVDENGEVLLDPRTGMPTEDPQMMFPSDRPVFEGDIMCNTVWGFNLLRHESAKSEEDNPLWIIRDLIPRKDLEKIYRGDDTKLSMIKDSGDDTFKVFHAFSGSYHTAKDSVMIRKYYYKPCMEYPNGYFYMTTSSGILEEMELPGGIYPIVFYPYETMPTTPRGFSIHKHLRHFQREINRSVSAIATHQVTVGDTKVFIQSGTKLAQGGVMPGIKAVTYTGQKPEYLKGEVGDQFMEYALTKVRQLYEAANLPELNETKEPQQVDVYAMLLKTARHKKKFSEPAERFEDFQVEVCERVLLLAKLYYPDSMLVPAVGKSEMVNLAEFRNTEPMHYQIRLEPSSEDVEAQIGKALMVNTMLQYVGPNMEKEDIGKLARLAPYVNKEEIFSSWTIDFDNVQNDILALDRGDFRPPNRYDNHALYIKHIIRRMKQADFRFLNPQIQQMYAQKLQMHEQAEAMQQQAIIDAKNEMIPTSGALVGVDIYVNDPDNPESSRGKRARLPNDSVEWLMQKLERQGATLEKLEALQKQAQLDILGYAVSGQGQQQLGPSPTAQNLPLGGIPNA